jgi:hypothetical protein
MVVHIETPQGIQEVYKAATAATSTQYVLPPTPQKPVKLNKPLNPRKPPTQQYAINHLAQAI